MFAGVPFLLVLAATAQSAPPETTGSICIAALPKNAREIDHDLPGGRALREYSYSFAVQLDSRKPVQVRTDSPTLLEHITIGKQHRIVIRDAGKAIESFRFTFEKRGSPNLCLWYGPWYQTWSLEPVTPAAKECLCELTSDPR